MISIEDFRLEALGSNTVTFPLEVGLTGVRNSCPIVGQESQGYLLALITITIIIVVVSLIRLTCLFENEKVVHQCHMFQQPSSSSYYIFLCDSELRVIRSTVCRFSATSS